MTEQKLKDGQPSRFHKYRWDHKTSTSKWELDCTHADMVSTAHVKIEYHVHCAYCAEKCRDIQALYGQWYRDYPYHGQAPSEYYQTTGYTCDCDGANAERELADAQKEFDRKVAIGRDKLIKRYRQRLTFNHKKLLEVKHKKELKELELSHSLSHILKISEPLKKKA